LSAVLKTFVKDTFIYGLAIVLPRLINFLLVPLYTNNLSTEKFSENTEFYVIVAFFNVMLTYGMETTFFRFFSQHKDKDKVLSTALITIVSTTLFFAIVLLAFRNPICEVLRINPDFYTILIAITLLEALILIPFAYLRVTGRPMRFASIKLINVLIIVVLNIVLLSETLGIPGIQKLFKVANPVEYIFIANLIASVVVLILVLPYFFKAKLQFDSKILKQMLRYTWPIMVAGIAFVINENFDKWLLPEVLGKDVNGAYSACYKLAVFMTLFIQAFRMGAEPFFFNQAKAKNAKKNYATILKYFTIFGAIGLMVITVFIDWVQPLFIKNESYLVALNIVPIVLLANLCLGIYHNLSIWYKLTDKTQYGMYISLLGAGITIAFNVIMIPRIGFMASAYATVLAYGVMMVVSYFLGKRHYQVPYDVKRIALYLLVSASLSFVAFYQFDHNILIGTLFLFIFLELVFVIEKN
jgi:O-antigen/teichoic acid export membrane protein